MAVTGSPEYGARGDGTRANIARAEAQLNNIKPITLDQRIALAQAYATLALAYRTQRV